MKKALSIFLLCALITTLFGGQVIIASAATSGDYTYEVSGTTATITDVSTSISGAVTIPSTLGGATVTSIGEHAFRGCSKITSITIPSSVTTIGSGAFYNCTGLTSVTFSGAVASIGTSAFYGCNNITSVATPSVAAWSGISFENLYSNPMCYGANIKVNGSTLTTLSIPSNITTVSDYAFYGWSTLSSVTISEGTVNIGDYAFAGCTSLSNLVIPSTIKNIGAHAFYNCDTITNVRFAGLIYLLGINFETLYSNPIYFATNVYEAGSIIKDISIPRSITKIGKNTFYGLKTLNSVTVPASVTSIGSNAFYGCENLTSVTAADITAWAGIDFENEYSNPLYYADTFLNNDSKVHNALLSEGITKIGDYAFANYAELYNVKIPAGVTEIGKFAFHGCTGLSDITLPGTLTTIGEDAFYGCDNITNVTMPSMNLLSNVALATYTSNPLYNAENAYVYTPVNANLSVAADTITIDGLDSNHYSNKNYTETVYLSTSKDAQYIDVVVKAHKYFTVGDITAGDFDSVEKLSSTTSGNYTYTTVRCTYSSSGALIPKNELVVAFDIGYTYSRSTPTTYTFSINSATIYGPNSATYSFTTLGSHDVTIVRPTTVPTDALAISGPSTIYDTAKYTVDFLPHNSYLKNSAITWSVSDTSLASITEDGTVTALVKTGSVIVTATTSDSAFTVSKSVNLSTAKRATIDGLTTDAGQWLNAFTPETRNYIVYIPTTTNSVKLTPTFTNGSLLVNGASVQSGKIKIISTTKQTTTVTLTRSGLTDALDSTYTITIVKTSPTTKTTVSEDGKTFNVTPILLTSGNHVVITLYKNGKLVEVQRKIYTGENITFNTTADYTSAKIMVLSGFDTIAPITEAESL